MAWSLVEVYGTWGPDGDHRGEGRWVATLPARLTSSSDTQILHGGEYRTGKLDVRAGRKSLSFMAPAVDDPDVDPPSWGALDLLVLFQDGTQERYAVLAPYAARPVSDGGSGAGVNLRDLDPVASAPGPTPYPRSYTGGGSPEGSISAEVGSYYTDLAGTGDDWLWVKKAGTGSTGWGLVHEPVAAADITDATAVGQALITAASAASARAVIAAISAADVTVDGLTDATTLGKALAKAADAAAARALIDTASTATVSGKVSKAGDTMTGALTVLTPTAAGHPAMVTAVDATVGRLAIGNVEMGDTGTRGISSLLSGVTAYGGASGARLRRDGNIVNLHFDLDWTSPPANGSTIATLPVGFRPKYTTYPPSTVSGNPNTVVVVTSSGAVVISTLPAAQTAIRIDVTFLASQAGGWPTTLPGTAL